jgi:hypothetical protein
VGREKIGQPQGVADVEGGGLGFAGLRGPAFIPESLFVSADLGQPIPQITNYYLYRLITSADMNILHL